MENKNLQSPISERRFCKMNALKIMSIMMMILLAFGLMVSAQENATLDDTEDVTVIDAGTTPDSVLYGLDKAIDSIRLALTFNKEKKAERALEIAEERLAEIKAMIDANKDREAEKAEKEHEKAVEKAKKSVEELESDGEEAKAEEALRKITKIQNKIESHHEKVLEVKTRILEKKSENITEEQLSHLEEVFDRIINKSQEMEQRLVQKKENVKTKYKVLSGKTDEEVEKTISEIEIEEGLAQEREVRVKREFTREGILKKLEIKIVEKTVDEEGNVIETKIKKKVRFDEKGNILKSEIEKETEIESDKKESEKKEEFEDGKSDTEKEESDKEKESDKKELDVKPIDGGDDSSKEMSDESKDSESDKSLDKSENSGDSSGTDKE